MKDYSAFIFDMDGTLVDSERIKGKALAETCLVFGGSVEVNVYKEVMGESWEYVANHFFKEADISPEIEQFNLEFKPIYEALLKKELLPNPNVIQYLEKLKLKGKRLVIVSSASKWMADQIIAQMELSEYFDFIITNELVSKHKPDPEAYFLALEKLALPNDEVLVFEDSEPGLIAANSAGCDVIAFQHAFNLNHDFHSALKIISNYNEMAI